MGRPTKHTESFRRDAIALVRSSGRPMNEVAKSLGVYKSTLWNWCQTGSGEDRNRPCGTKDRCLRRSERLRSRFCWSDPSDLCSSLSPAPGVSECHSGHAHQRKPQANMNRLAMEFPSIAAALPITPIEHRKVGIAFARGVARNVPLQDEAVNRWIANGALDRLHMQSLVSDLDEIAWGIADQLGPADKSYVAAFARARAANSIWFATGENPTDAADAIYEGLAALASAGISPQALLEEVGLH
jgi:Transposase